MSEKRYEAIEVIQQPEAPPMYLIVISASELLEWCDVPRTKETYMAGYQRLLNDKRTKDITDYLMNDPQNTLPGSVIVATDEEYVKIEKDSNRVTLVVKEDTRTREDKLHELFGGFSTRLSSEELSSAEIEFSDENFDEDECEEFEQPSSYLAVLAKELNQLLTDPDNVQPERLTAIDDYIDGISKPGLIIDGQHRVIGAKNVTTHDVMLPVLIMQGLPHQEQVFQFFVLNSKAKPLKPTELRRIISTSLATPEIDDLYSRFKKTGIDAYESKWSYELNTSQQSVFKGLIDFGLGTSGAIIPENVADQLLRAFMKMPDSRYSMLTKPIGERWQDQAQRISIFFALWKAISEKYSNLWNHAISTAKRGEQHQIFKKVSLLTLQKFLLDRFVTALPYRGKGASAPFANDESIKEMVMSTLENLPEKFFQLEWKYKQMDTSEGRKVLYDEMAKTWDNQGRNIGNQKLFRG